MEKVSVLVPVYGVEKFIERCAHSLFGQTYENIEYIFVDDCTKDLSIEVLQGVLLLYPERRSSVKVIRHEKNRGLSAARNTALDHATGEYLLHVDSDDFLEKNAVELLTDKAVKTGADIVVCASNSVYEHRSFFSPCLISADREEYIKQLLNKSVSPSIWGKLFLARFYRETGVRSIEGLNHGEDYATVPRLVYFASRISTINVALYNYVKYNQSAYTSNISRKSIDDMIWADAVLNDFFSQLSERDLYEKTLLTMKLRTKLSLFKMGNPDIYGYAASLYPDLYPAYKSFISLPDRILLDLIGWKLYRFAHFYARCGLWFKRKMTSR